MKLLLYFIAAHIILLSCAKNQKVAGKSKDINSNDSSDMTGKLKNWHPGHYVLLAENERVADIELPGGFRGYQVKYKWKDLEPADGQFDFSRIDADLASLKSDQYLVIQIQTKSFVREETLAPPYFLTHDVQLPSGEKKWLYRTSAGALNPIAWDSLVDLKIKRLYSRLGQTYRAHNKIEAFVLNETATSMNPARLNQEQKDIVPFDDARYAAYLGSQMHTLKNNLPRTVVIQFTNFPVSSIDLIIAKLRPNRVGLGGPDIFPGVKLDVYSRYRRSLADSIPFGTAVQYADYDTLKNYSQKQQVDTIYKIGRDQLYLNYIFWRNRADYFNTVKQAVDSITKKYGVTGGLRTEIPILLK